MITTKPQTHVAAEQALAAVQDFAEENLGNLIGVGQPNRMVTGLRSAWIVPLILTSPGYGIVGVVGSVMVDDELGYIVGWTPVDEVRANIEQISHAKAAELEAAFQAISKQPSALVH